MNRIVFVCDVENLTKRGDDLQDHLPRGEAIFEDALHIDSDSLTVTTVHTPLFSEGSNIVVLTHRISSGAEIVSRKARLAHPQILFPDSLLSTMHLRILPHGDPRIVCQSG